MKIHHLTPEEVAESLHSGPAGLTTAVAVRRLQEFGANKLEQVRGTPMHVRFLKGFTHFFALILWLAAGLAFLAGWFDPGAGMATLGAAILGVIVINGVFSFWQEYRAEKALAALLKLLPHQVKVVRDGKMHPLPAEELVPGDLILLSGGDEVPADCRVMQAFGVRVNTATVTGESVPQSKDERPDEAEEYLHSRNVLLAGTSLVAGEGRALVFATGMHTEFGKIARLSQNSRASISPLQQEIVYLSRLVAAVALALGITFFFIGQALGLPFWYNFLFAIGIIVANVPEGLLPTVTLSLALASQRMARRNALVRHLPAVETLGSATVICTDKTGTLTRNEMAVKQLYLAGQIQPVAVLTGAANDPAHAAFFAAVLACHTLEETETATEWTALGDPLEVALVRMARAACGTHPVPPRVDEVPFDSDRKRMSTLHRTPAGLVLYCKGALEALLPLCSHVQTASGMEPLSAAIQHEWLHVQDRMADDGLRVLAFAHRMVAESYDREHLEEGLTLAGLVALEDPPRPEVPDAIRKCHEAGIRVIMVTGDHPHTAAAVARQIGLVGQERERVITGQQLRRMSPTQLQIALDRRGILFARVAADQKMRIVEALKAKKEVVAVTGDGVNDAPALRKADIGIAMGLSGTDVARAAADMVLLDDNFASVVAAVEEGRAVYANIRKFLTYILTSNVPELIPYLAFVLFRVPLALTIIQILVVDLGTDMLPALGLGADRPEPGTMTRPPRPRTERLLNAPLLARSYLFLGVLEALPAMAAFFFVLVGGGWSYGQTLANDDLLYRQATTACLSAIVVMQVVNVFLCRSERASVASLGRWSNKLILGGIAAEVAMILLIDYTPLGNLLFGTAPIGISVWLFILPFAGFMWTLEEVRKWVIRRGCIRLAHTDCVR